MNSVTLFLWEVVTHWSGLMTGGIVIALLAMYEHWRGQSLRWGLFLVIATCAFIASSYFAWNDEHEKRLGAEKVNERVLAVRDRQAIKAMLQRYYTDGGKLFDRQLDRNISTDEFNAYVANVNQWALYSSNGIEQTIGIGAKERFLDTSGQPSFAYQKAISEQHNNVLNYITHLRHNLVVLVESAAWDKPAE